MRLDRVKIKLPIINSTKSENYALILTDSDNIIHYFNFDGTYDGYSQDIDECNKNETNDKPKQI